MKKFRPDFFQSNRTEQNMGKEEKIHSHNHIDILYDIEYNKNRKTENRNKILFFLPFENRRPRQKSGENRLFGDRIAFGGSGGALSFAQRKRRFAGKESRLVIMYKYPKNVLCNPPLFYCLFQFDIDIKNISAIMSTVIYA